MLWKLDQVVFVDVTVFLVFDQLVSAGGVFEAVLSGTVFVEEVADVALALEVNLLGAIEEKSLRCVGGQQEQVV
ncbi:sigma 54-interacting transcriptional regulator, partial [Pseudomonas syringae pv. tagetis]